MNYAIIYNTSTGVISAVNQLQPPTPIDLTATPIVYFDVYDQIVPPSGQSKMRATAADSAPRYSDLTYYVATPSGTPTLTPKISLDTNNSVGGANPWLANGTSVYSYGPNLPSATSVTVECSNQQFGLPRTFTVNDGKLEFATTITGTYTFTTNKFPYLDKVLSIQAT